ncbi:4-coumarate--CoA ligase 1-like [Vespula maculifrons]|uniref:4-coumarate--CoA ligase 1-like n=1 Tax=Vespula maculifrons TaxID=7453 RepID=A0ABD2CRH1_VESMC
MMRDYYNNPEATNDTIDDDVTERELQKLVAKNITDSYHLRGGVKFVEKIPHTASKKISRKDLNAIAKSYQRLKETINLLRSHPNIVEIMIVGVSHILDDEHPITFVTKVSNSKYPNEILMNWR